MSNEKKIKVGVFGLGRGGAYLQSFLTCNAEIVAVCDQYQNRVDNTIKSLGDGVTGYNDFDKFIEHDMDAVLLANYFTEHTKYAIRCLEKGISVLSECCSNLTMAEGVALVRAAEKSNAIYMLAENYPYMIFNKEMKKVYGGGTLGKCIFAEGEYNHPEDPDNDGFVRHHRPFTHHWRNYLARCYYITHSLGPLMYITGGTPKKVTAFLAFSPDTKDGLSGLFVGDAAAIINTLNDDDSIFRVTGCAGFGAHDVSYRICGQHGQIENVRGMGDKVMLRYNPWNLPEGESVSKLYDPAWNDKDEALIKKTGHGGSDFLVVRNFLDCIRENKKPDFDVYFATTMASVAILAHRSALNGGASYDVPDFRREEDRKLWENDTLTPFPNLDGTGATLPCCSRPDYQPSEEEYAKYREVVGENK